MKKLPHIHLLQTGDGSMTLAFDDDSETFHSRHGAKTESEHVFIQNGLDLFSGRTKLNVLEMGFGTGLNALLSWNWALNNKCQVNFRSLEAFPLPVKVWSEVGRAIGKENTDQFMALHKCNWENKVELSDFFVLMKEVVKLEEWTPKDWKCDIVFYDAFGPKTQPDLWTVQALERVCSVLVDDGYFVTYCAQGQFKRNLKSLGMEVESLPGPPGKREMTRAFRR